MKPIQDKYRLSVKDLDFKVVEILDFKDYPILTLEKDDTGNSYLSYLIEFDKELENRVFIPVSKERISVIRSGEVSIKYAFENPESSNFYLLNLSATSGDLVNAYFLPSILLSEIIDIPADYTIAINVQNATAILESEELLSISRAKNKIVLDVYVMAKDLVNNVKPWAVFKVVTPIVQILKQFLDIDNRNIDNHLAFSNFRQKSFGVTIEFNTDYDLFDDSPKNEEVKKLITLLSCTSKEDLNKVLAATKSEAFIRQYATIIKALVAHKGVLHSAFADSVKGEVYAIKIDTNQAKALKKIIDESFPQINDTEEIEGIFYEIDIAKKTPTFTIYLPDEDETLNGTIDDSIMNTLKHDKINIGEDIYIVTVKTVFNPETTIKKSSVDRILINYKIKG